jgi:hypothetical protein
VPASAAYWSPRFGSRPEGGAITSHVRSHRPAVTSTMVTARPPTRHNASRGAASVAAVTKDTGSEPASTEAGTTEKTLIPADRLNENSRVMSSSRTWAQAAAIDGELRFGNGFTTAEHPDILRLFSTLDIPLAHYTAAGTQLELSVQNRDRPGQLTTLGCWIVGWSHLCCDQHQEGLDRCADRSKRRPAPSNRRENSGRPGAPDLRSRTGDHPLPSPHRLACGNKHPAGSHFATARQETTVSRPTTRPGRRRGKLNWRRKESPTMGGCGPHWSASWSPTKNGVTAITHGNSVGPTVCVG